MGSMDQDRVRGSFHTTSLGGEEHKDWGTSSGTGCASDRESLISVKSKEDVTDFPPDQTLSAQRTNYPSSKDIITKTLISPGPPAVHQLNTKKESFGNSTKIIFRDKHETKPNKTILLVGETGAGKSTLVNVLLNYAMGTKFEDEVWNQIVEEEEEDQTSDVVVYQMFGLESLPFSLTIIDTPGFGDTRGNKRGDIIIQKLLNLFGSKDGVHEIDAVGLVMKATDNRMSDRLMYVFDSVMSLFGKDLEKNIVALMTHSDGRKPKNALQALEVANIKTFKNELIYFLFNNCQHEDRTERRELLEQAHKTSLKGFEEFMAFLNKTKPQPLITTVEVLNERIRLKAAIQNLREKIELTEQNEKKIKQIKEGCNNKEEIKENFTIEVDEAYKDKEPIDGGMWGLVFYEGATTCPVCEENCHYPECTMAWTPEHCWVMKRGRCTVCTNKCPASDHVKEKWIYVTKTRKVQKTLDVKEKYEKDTESLSLLDQAYSHVIRLEQIALRAESVSTLVHLDFLIEKMKEKGDQEKVRKLEEMKSKMNEGTKAALRYAKKE